MHHGLMFPLTGLRTEELRRKAELDGVPLEKASWAEGLTVRVVNNVNKVQEVKPHFHDAFKADGFPSSLPYRQKVRTINCSRRVSSWEQALGLPASVL